MPVLPTGGKSWQVTNDFGNQVTNKDVPGLPAGVWQHTGVDYLLGGSSAASQNQPVYAAANGIVIFSTKSNTNPLPGRGGLVIIRHLAPRGSKFVAAAYNGRAGNYEKFQTEEIYTYYLHLDEDKILVKTGDNVDGGAQIASLYDSKNKKYVYVPHLHFEIWSVCSGAELNGYEPDGTLKKSLKKPIIDPISFLSNVKITGSAENAETAEIPTMFLLDVSGSMEDNDKITQAKNSGLDAIGEMQENRRRGRDNSNVSIWTFGGECNSRDVREILPFTKNLTQAETTFRLRIPKPSGLTPLYTAINLTVERMSNYLAPRPDLPEGWIIVLSDGENTCGEQIRPRGVYSQGSRIIYQKIRFLTIGFDVSAGSQAERDLQYLSSVSGGRYFPAANQKQLSRSFEKLFRVYQPKAPANANADFERGNQAIRSRNFETAIVVWSEYVKANPADALGFYNLALACEAAGFYKRAVENYKIYLILAADASDLADVRLRIAKLEEDYRVQVTYYLNLLRSDLEYLKAYYKRLFEVKNNERAAEFAGFVAEKGSFYRNLAKILEIRSSRIERNANDLADSLDYLNRRVASPSFDRDAVSLLTMPIDYLEQLIKRVEEHNTQNLK